MLQLVELTDQLCKSSPSIETCLPSIVNCTSALCLVVALKHLDPACHIARLGSDAADLESCVRIILTPTPETKERRAIEGQ